jgi:hypothetical protein
MGIEDRITQVHAEPVIPHDSDRLAHLAAHRGLIIKRSLLISAIRGFLPVPMLDDVLAGRLSAGLYQKLASGRQVDLPPASAAVLAEAGGQSTAAKLTLTAATAILAKFAGRKVLALLAAGRSADDMARNFFRATLFDHYCVKMHVGGPITSETAGRLRSAIFAQEKEFSLSPLLAAFRVGSKILGRSILEAPRWVAQQVASLAERFVASGGNPDVLDAIPVRETNEDAWIDRATQAVEEVLGRAGNQNLAPSIKAFEERWQRERH